MAQYPFISSYMAHSLTQLTHTSEEAATTATYFPDIAPAAILQSIYILPHQHNTGCSLLDSTCECILAIVPFN